MFRVVQTSPLLNSRMFSSLAEILYPAAIAAPRLETSNGLWVSVDLPLSDLSHEWNVSHSLLWVSSLTWHRLPRATRTIPHPSFPVFHGRRTDRILWIRSSAHARLGCFHLSASE